MKYKNVMYIGLDFLQILDEKELESVFVHEFAHIYNEDTLISGKISRNITRWEKILGDADEKGQIVHIFLTKFAVYYIKLMQMHIKAIQKQKEYIADREAVRYTNKEIYFSASTKITLFDYYINNSSKDSQRLDLRTYDSPPDNYYNLIYDDFKKLYRIHKEQYHQQIMKTVSTKYDSHPSYKERMDKMGITEYYFNLNLERDITFMAEVDKLISKFNLKWQKNASSSWKNFTQPYKESNALVEKFEHSENEEKNLKYGLALEDLLRFDEALNTYKQMLEKQPECASASYRIGIIKLNQNDIAGIDYLKNAINIESALIQNGLEEINKFIQLNNLTELKKEMSEWAWEKSKLLGKIKDENANIRLRDKFASVEIDAEKLAILKNKLG